MTKTPLRKVLCWRSLSCIALSKTSEFSAKSVLKEGYPYLLFHLLNLEIKALFSLYSLFPNLITLLEEGSSRVSRLLLVGLGKANLGLDVKANWGLEGKANWLLLKSLEPANCKALLATSVVGNDNISSTGVVGNNILAALPKPFVKPTAAKNGSKSGFSRPFSLGTLLIASSAFKAFPLISTSGNTIAPLGCPFCHTSPVLLSTYIGFTLSVLYT